MNWPPVFHLQWLGHVPHFRQHLPTTIVWNSPMRELIGSVMVSSLLLPTFGTLSLPLYFRLPSTFLPSKGRSITTLGARWHDFFIFLFFITLFRCSLLTLFRYFIKLFYYTSFPFSRDADSRKGTLCPFCVPIHKKKKKKISTIVGGRSWRRTAAGSGRAASTTTLVSGRWVRGSRGRQSQTSTLELPQPLE